MKRIVVADDRALFRAGICRLLADQPDLQIVETATGAELIERVTEANADVVLLAVTSDWARIVPAIPALRSAGPNILVLATDPADHHIDSALSAGALAVLSTAVNRTGLLDALRRAADGLAPDAGAAECDSPARPLPVLSDREFEVMQLLGSGSSVKEVAARLELSPKTVGTYRGRVMDKLDLRSTAELVRFVLERGLAE
jgi:two-component system invasion response regulator UvrY